MQTIEQIQQQENIKILAEVKLSLLKIKEKAKKINKKMDDHINNHNHEIYIVGSFDDQKNNKKKNNK